MHLTGTVLKCSARKVNTSSDKQTYVTNLLVLDPDNASGMNYAVEVWDEEPHEVPLKTEVTLTIIGVLTRNAGIPTLRGHIKEEQQAAAA